MSVGNHNDIGLGRFFSSSSSPSPESHARDYYSCYFFTMTKVYWDHLLILGEETSVSMYFKRQCCHVKRIPLG